MYRTNQAQREGLAKLCDSCATACFVAVAVGLLVDGKVGWWAGLSLFGIGAILVASALFFRREGA